MYSLETLERKMIFIIVETVSLDVLLSNSILSDNCGSERVQPTREVKRDKMGKYTRKTSTLSSSSSHDNNPLDRSTNYSTSS